MDLTPLYELRERLRAGAIAGAALAADDFRLSRALEGLAPLEKASPVFAKIGALTRSALAPDCQDRAGALLDAVTLCDSVLCTQAAVAVAGELAPLPRRTGGSVLTNAPYSVVAPLVEALTTSGSGHFTTVSETRNSHPELFSDYRIREALVSALGAGYSELADAAGQWLSKEDEALLPLLTEGFDPAGKKEMARRVQVIDAIAGEKMNAWYLEQLPQAKKAIRPPLIYALRHDPENGPLLLQLARKEKGDNKAAALWALARTEAPEAADFWREQVEQDFPSAVQHFIFSDSSVATGLTAELFLRELEDCCGDPKRLQEHLKNLLYALVGKTGEAVCEVYRRAAALKTALDDNRAVMIDGRPVDQTMLFWCGADRSSQPFSVVIADTLARSVQLTGDPTLCALAEELYERYGGLWAGPALVGALLTRSGEEAAALGRKAFAPSLLQKLTGDRKRLLVEKMVFGTLLGQASGPADQQGSWPSYYQSVIGSTPVNRPCYRVFFADPAVGTVRAFPEETVYIPIAAPLDGWWYDLFIQQNMEQYLRAFADFSDPALCQKIGAYFERRIRTGSLKMNLTAACVALQRCGWQDWKGLISSYALHTSEPLSYWEFRNNLQSCPLTNSEKAGELHAVWTSGKYSGWPDKAIEHQLEEWWKE